MTRKLIFFDIDGTLLDHDKRLPASTKQAIQSLQEAGHQVALATGRSPFMCKDLRNELGIGSYVSYNGQYVVSNGNVIYKNPLNERVLESLTAVAVANQHPMVYMDHETMRANVEYHPHIETSISSLKVAHPACDPNYFRGREIYQSLLFCTEQEEQPYRANFPEFYFIRWHEFSMDVLPSGGSKARGIERMIQHLGFHPDDVYAFGDALNDIEMLKYVRNSVAMGNAPDSVKQVAKHVTKDVSEDGIAYGLEMLGLI